MPKLPKPDKGPKPQLTGFPAAVLDFYEDLENDNTKVFWDAHKAFYDSAIRAPMVALTQALAAEFGPAKVFRPYRDVRFSRDKAPYKTSQGAFVGVAPQTGYYVQVSAAGLRTAGGFYRASSAGLALVRAAIDGPDGGELQRITAGLRRAGWEIGGETLKTAPRGYRPDHPRIELLRHRSLTAGRTYGFDPDLYGDGLVDLLRSDWRLLRPLVQWLAARLAGTGEPAGWRS